jgi:threonine/homoserine/homoserine lactone efflux protein
MDPVLVGEFWLVAALLALTPGADWAYAISAGVQSRSFVPSILGMLAGYSVVITVVAVGLGAVLTRFPTALLLLTVAGAAYLLWLGLGALLRRAGELQADDRVLGRSATARFLRGAGVSGFNPKGLLLLLALLPQFTTPAGLPSAVQMLVLGALHLLDCAVVYSAVAALARRLLTSRPRATVVVSKLAGVAMLAIGASLLVERVVTAV